MEFDWDPNKDGANVRKHGISFLRASFVFEDQRLLVEESTKPEHGEARRKAIGMAGGVVITVIYTDRYPHRRIISARRASRDERVRYQRAQFDPSTSAS